MTQRLGGHALVEQLISLGADTAFCVPGESYLPVLDGLYDSREEVRLITARQEGGAALMAAAYGKLTGKPGICLVTRGPGATNASIGVHVARQDASPMILLIGQVGANQVDRRAFQEVDYRSMFGTLAKEVLQIDQADRIPELVARAYRAAVSGEPGPIVVVLPENVLGEMTEARLVEPVAPVAPSPAPADVERFVAALEMAERPLLVIGGSGWTEEATVRMREFAEHLGVPVATAVRHQDLFDNNSEVFVGTLGLNTTPGLADLVGEADLVAMVGTRPDALTVNSFRLLDAPTPRQRILHVHPDPDLLHRVYRADLAIPAGAAQFAAALHNDGTPRPVSQWVKRLRANYLREPVFAGTGADPAPYMAILNARLPADAVMTAGAGNYTLWHQQYRSYSVYPSQVSTQSGAMGYGLPAALAAKLVLPERTVVAFAGDGCMLMTGQELATASQYGIDVLVIVVNNSSYGTIRMHQESRFPGRVSGTALSNPDFAALARAFGARGAQVRTPAEFELALDEMLSTPGLALIEILTA